MCLIYVGGCWWVDCTCLCCVVVVIVLSVVVVVEFGWSVSADGSPW